jgi:hypothetical protein
MVNVNVNVNDNDNDNDYDHGSYIEAKPLIFKVRPVL